jgi:hypothetical protein
VTIRTLDIIEPELRLSAQRALLGAIHPSIRLVKIKREGSNIRLTVVAVAQLDDEAAEAVSVAATEIVADFPTCQIEARVLVTTEALPDEDILTEGWVYQRLERNVR